MVYEDVVGFADLIHHSIEERSMPTWPADPSFRHFVNEAYLSQEEINLIHEWIDTEMPYGDPSILPQPPSFISEGSLLEHIDFTIEMEPYTLQYNTDEYRWFVIENPFDEPLFIEKIEVVPGLANVVHHADLFLDNSGTSLNLDLLDPISGFNSDTGAPYNSQYINAWQPGGNIIEYPENWGFVIPPNSDFVFEIHYGPGGQGLVDSTKMNLQFIMNPINVREVKAKWLMTDVAPTLIDGPLLIPANEIVDFHQITAPMPKDLSLIAICPHMHFLGKSYKVWFETIEGDSIPLINIPNWDFHWQKYYAFQSIQKLPEGAVLKSEGYYDNTSNNHDNPYNPPQTIGRGLTTQDEMFLVFFIYSDYQTGDESILMDSTLLSSSEEVERIKSDLLVFPNPTENSLSIHCQVCQNDMIALNIFDIKGKLVKRNRNLNWDHGMTTFNIDILDSGLYFIRGLLKNGQVINGRFIKS